MRFCQPHWDALRAAIDARGLKVLVSESGEEVVRKLAAEMQEGTSIDNFDPLMGAHNAILANAMAKIGGAGPGGPAAVMHLMTTDTCPICYLNELGIDPRTGLCPCGCGKAGEPFDWMIERAADDQVEAWKLLGS